MADDVWILKQAIEYEELIKKSRFLMRAVPIQTEAEALAYIQQVSDAQATHNCWAYKIGTKQRFSDDGEPGGTAGKPMLLAIEGAQCDFIVAVVTRWFGGIKLGPGGLMRAYGGVVAKALNAAEKEKWEFRVSCQLACTFADMARIKDYLVREGVLFEEEVFEAQGVVWRVSLLPVQQELVRQKLLDMTRGQTELKECVI